MPNELKLNHPWLVAVWPGMGNVALSAGYYLMAKLGMHLLSEYSPRELFDVEHVEVSDGLIRVANRPRSRFFVWIDPKQERDLVIFIGEAQPPAGKYAFCERLIGRARELGVERVFTFAAMATQMHPEHDSRVFAAATNTEVLAQLRRLELEVLTEGHIGGLNGVLLGAAAEGGLPGACMLGEMPHIFSQLPFPKASLAVLEAFTTLAGIQIDLTELQEQAKAMEEKLGELLAQVEKSIEQQQRQQRGLEEEPEFPIVPPEDDDEEEKKLSPRDEQHIEELFGKAREDRSCAYELKRELDRLEVFKDYEDRFLDLFQKPDS